MPTIEYRIIAGEEEQEILLSTLSDYRATGFEQKDNELLAYFELKDYNKEEVEGLLTKHTYSVSTIEDRNWNAEWEANFEPVQVGNFCSIRASFHAPIEGSKHEIIITPKMSFGTGHHATTYLMIEFMEGLQFQNKNVFDFGTGTGILAILSKKLGAASVQAIDIDEWSINNAKENAEINNCSAIEIWQSSELPENSYDIVLANINRNVILEHLPDLEKIVPNEGFLLVSGILIADEKDIVETSARCGFDRIEQKERRGWLSILFKRRI